MRFLVLFGMFLGCFSASNQPIHSGLGNSLVFTIHGNVYPQGYVVIGFVGGFLLPLISSIYRNLVLLFLGFISFPFSFLGARFLLCLLVEFSESLVAFY